MRVLGVDPGSAITGYGVIERRGRDLECVDCGTIPGGAGALPDRLLCVYDGLTAVIEAFGPARGMFESNFPVQRRWCSYQVVWNAFKRLAAGASAGEKADLFAGTAARAYRMTDVLSS